VLRKTLIVSVLTILTAVALPQAAEAQRRAIRRPSGRSVIYVARPYYPVYYSPFYSGWYPGWYGSGWYGWYPHGFYGQYMPYRYRYDYAGSARLEVRPREAEVYIDGYLVGTVDDFDGWLQRLHVAPGEHEIHIYWPGYRTFRERVLFRPGATIRISHELEPLPAGEAGEPRPTPSAGSPAYPPRTPRGDADDRSGTIAIRVQPSDAEVSIDGERWDSPQGGDRLVVQLGEGEHRVEIRRDGYAPFTTTVRIRRGVTSPLNVSLTRQD
jgi:hypothetical protein